MLLENSMTVKTKDNSLEGKKSFLQFFEVTYRHRSRNLNFVVAVAKLPPPIAFFIIIFFLVSTLWNVLIV